MESKFKHPPRGIDVRPDHIIKDGANKSRGLLSQYGIIGAAQIMFKSKVKNIKVKIFKPKTNGK